MEQLNYTHNQSTPPLQAAAGKPGKLGMAIDDNRPQRNTVPATIQRQASNGKAPVQRVIVEGGTRYEKSTLKTILKDPAIGAKVAAVIALIRTNIGTDINEKWLESSWNAVVKASDYDIDTDRDALVDAVTASYGRSAASGKARKARGQDADTIFASLAAVDPDLVQVQQGREQVVGHKHPHQLDTPQNTTAPTRAATHAATVVLAQHPLGVEVQGALQHDGMGMMLSSNKNKANADISGQLKVAADLKQMAAELLIKEGAIVMGKEDLMKNRVLRHASKLYLNIAKLLAADAPITVPQKVATFLDGLHAEIRIELDEWSEATHELPYGTRLPCMGCYMYFAGQRIPLGKWMGPLWLSNPGMAKQIEDLLLAKVNMGKMGADRAKAVGKKIADSYAELPDDSHMAKSKKRDGTYTYDHDPDSEPENDLDDAQHADLVMRLIARQSGVPASPQWDGMEDWAPPSAKAQPSLDDIAEEDEMSLAPTAKIAKVPPKQKGTPWLNEEQLKQSQALGMKPINFVYGGLLSNDSEQEDLEPHSSNVSDMELEDSPMQEQGVIAFNTWEEASYRKLKKGQEIRILHNGVNIADRIFRLKEDYDPSYMEYPDIGRYVEWIRSQ